MAEGTQLQTWIHQFAQEWERYTHLDIITEIPYKNNQQRKKNYIREFGVRAKIPTSLPDYRSTWPGAPGSSWAKFLTLQPHLRASDDGRDI